MVEFIRREFDSEDIVLVSPDAGGVKRYVCCSVSIYLVCQP